VVFNVLDDNDHFTSIDGVFFGKNDDLTTLTLLKFPVRYPYDSYEIPISVSKISSFVFEDCLMLTSITIPASVTSIETGAFRSCDVLSRVQYLGKSDPGKSNLPIFVFDDHYINITVPEEYKNNHFCGIYLFDKESSSSSISSSSSSSNSITPSSSSISSSSGSSSSSSISSSSSSSSSVTSSSSDSSSSSSGSGSKPSTSSISKMSYVVSILASVVIFGAMLV